jgi:hypothetical protein
VTPRYKKQQLFIMKTSSKQLYPIVAGINYNYYTFTSVGILLKKKEILAKVHKRSRKGLKVYSDYFEDLYKQGNLSHIYLKPISKKLVNILKIFYIDYKVKGVTVGFKKYSCIVFTRHHRIKKRISKKLLLNETKPINTKM